MFLMKIVGEDIKFIIFNLKVLIMLCKLFIPLVLF